MNEQLQDMLDHLPSPETLRKMQAERLVEAALLKPLIQAAEAAERWKNRQEQQGAAGQAGSRDYFIDSATLAKRDNRPTWLAKGALIEGELTILVGPPKSLKSSIAMDLAISLASATPWLGHFFCPTPRRVAFLYGGSSKRALQSMARRACDAKGVNGAAIGSMLLWSDRLPKLGIAEQLDALRRWLERDKIDVVIIDPACLCLLSGGDAVKAENMPQMGLHLLTAADAFHSVGATLILIHHTIDPITNKLMPLDISDLECSDLDHFARQWILLSRREAFSPDRPHRLWMVAGGNAGHCGTYGVDIDEGRHGEDFEEGVWHVGVRPRDNKAKAKNQQKIADQRREDAANPNDGRAPAQPD